MISLNQLTSLVNSLKSVDKNTARTIIKLVNVDVLKSLGDSKYLIQINDKTLTAQSQKQLQEGSSYFARYDAKQKTLPQLSKLINIPNLFKNQHILKDANLTYDIKTLQHILNSKEPAKTIKEQILDELSKSQNKEHFQTVSNLLLSLNQNVLSFPFIIYEYFGLLQLKKRYNKKTKKSYLNFYAIFEHLGPISGVISEDSISLNVAYDEIKDFLDENLDEISYNITLHVMDNIEPLYDINKNDKLLDIQV